MKNNLRLALSFAATTTVSFAVYAPIPEQEQGKALSFRLGASVYHDSNIFGAATNEVDSMVYSLMPAIAFNSSVTQQTFLSASYELHLDHMPDRPGDKTLVSHFLNARVAHKFSEDTTADFTDTYQISKNPESLLPGVATPTLLNTDQSFKSNEFDAHVTTAIGQKTGVTVKYRNLDYSYDNAGLATDLDRMEHLAGMELSYALLPETKLVGEYRYQVINYDNNSTYNKDKRSNFLLAGVDYTPGKKTTMSGRLGFENRKREGASNTTAPYAELSGRYAYTEGSFLAAGYIYTFEEVSNTDNYTDTQVNRFFLNVQHRLTALITASGSLTFEPSRLQGRPGVPGAHDINETATRLGLGLSWLPNKNWIVSATYDVDHITSGDSNREQDRNRIGVTARLTF
jgi:opacity protein-like surface antigen